MDSQIRILVVEHDPVFRKSLKALCARHGAVQTVENLDESMELLGSGSWDLLLLDWHLKEIPNEKFYSTALKFQPNACLVALFTSPRLNEVVAAMKAGASDVFWSSQPAATLDQRLQVWTSQIRESKSFSHPMINPMVESLSERAFAKNVPLTRARKEFSKLLIQRMIDEKKVQRVDLARLMNVSPRTLYRLLSA